MSPDKVWELDVRVAAIWVRDGSRALWEMDHEELQQHWAAALNDKTDLWPREDELARERWQVWKERLQALSREHLDEETRAVVKEAADVLRAFLKNLTSIRPSYPVSLHGPAKASMVCMIWNTKMK